MIYLKIIFLVLFVLELHQTKFKKKSEKHVWFLIVVVFGFYGYSFYLAFKKRLVVKRKFNPNFTYKQSIIK